MPADPPILAYEPPRAVRRLSPLAASVVAHCLASYAVAVGVLTYLRLVVGVSPWTVPGWRWLAGAPVRIPWAFSSSFLKAAALRTWPETPAMAWGAVFVAVFALTFCLLTRRRTLEDGKMPA